MKKFNFKMDGLLKLREFEEKKAKINLGKVLAQITIKENEIKKIKKEIGIGYNDMEELLKEPTKGNIIQFFPYYFSGKQADIKSKEREIEDLNAELQQRKLELKKAEGEYKSIDKIREKKFEKYKDEINKKEQKDVDDHTIMKYGGGHD